MSSCFFPAPKGADIVAASSSTMLCRAVLLVQLLNSTFTSRSVICSCVSATRLRTSRTTTSGLRTRKTEVQRGQIARNPAGSTRSRGGAPAAGIDEEDQGEREVDDQSEVTVQHSRTTLASPPTSSTRPDARPSFSSNQVVKPLLQRHNKVLAGRPRLSLLSVEQEKKNHKKTSTARDEPTSSSGNILEKDRDGEKSGHQGPRREKIVVDECIIDDVNPWLDLAPCDLSCCPVKNSVEDDEVDVVSSGTTTPPVVVPTSCGVMEKRLNVLGEIEVLKPDNNNSDHHFLTAIKQNENYNLCGQGNITRYVDQISSILKQPRLRWEAEKAGARVWKTTCQNMPTCDCPVTEWVPVEGTCSVSCCPQEAKMELFVVQNKGLPTSSPSKRKIVPCGLQKYTRELADEKQRLIAKTATAFTDPKLSGGTGEVKVVVGVEACSGTALEKYDSCADADLLPTCERDCGLYEEFMADGRAWEKFAPAGECSAECVPWKMLGGGGLDDDAKSREAGVLAADTSKVSHIPQDESTTRGNQKSSHVVKIQHHNIRQRVKMKVSRPAVVGSSPASRAARSCEAVAEFETKRVILFSGAGRSPLASAFFETPRGRPPPADGVISSHRTNKPPATVTAQELLEIVPSSSALQQTSVSDVELQNEKENGSTRPAVAPSPSLQKNVVISKGLGRGNANDYTQSSRPPEVEEETPRPSLGLLRDEQDDGVVVEEDQHEQEGSINHDQQGGPSSTSLTPEGGADSTGTTSGNILSPNIKPDHFNISDVTYEHPFVYLTLSGMCLQDLPLCPAPTTSSVEHEKSPLSAASITTPTPDTVYPGLHSRWLGLRASARDKAEDAGAGPFEDLGGEGEFYGRLYSSRNVTKGVVAEKTASTEMKTTTSSDEEKFQNCCCIAVVLLAILLGLNTVLVLVYCAAPDPNSWASYLRDSAEDAADGAPSSRGGVAAARDHHLQQRSFTNVFEHEEYKQRQQLAPGGFPGAASTKNGRSQGSDDLLLNQPRTGEFLQSKRSSDDSNGLKSSDRQQMSNTNSTLMLPPLVGTGTSSKDGGNMSTTKGTENPNATFRNGTGTTVASKTSSDGAALVDFSQMQSFGRYSHKLDSYLSKLHVGAAAGSTAGSNTERAVLKTDDRFSVPHQLQHASADHQLHGSSLVGKNKTASSGTAAAGGSSMQSAARGSPRKDTDAPVKKASPSGSPTGGNTPVKQKGSPKGSGSPTTGSPTGGNTPKAKGSPAGSGSPTGSPTGGNTPKAKGSPKGSGSPTGSPTGGNTPRNKGSPGGGSPTGSPTGGNTPANKASSGSGSSPTGSSPTGTGGNNTPRKMNRGSPGGGSPPGGSPTIGTTPTKKRSPAVTPRTERRSSQRRGSSEFLLPSSTQKKENKPRTKPLGSAAVGGPNTHDIEFGSSSTYAGGSVAEVHHHHQHGSHLQQDHPGGIGTATRFSGAASARSASSTHYSGVVLAAAAQLRQISKDEVAAGGGDDPAGFSKERPSGGTSGGKK
ncbi:unnamed protein product [Amoebophrya sp. A120]|nr:unnamed protein product [Amoebophrya sp. A120]|eukprot:GSA120T00014576001.1